MIQTRRGFQAAQTRFAPAAAALADPGPRALRFTFATSNVARDGDRILPGAWQLDNFRRNPVFLFAHDATKPPIGKVIEIGERGGKLTGAVRFGDSKFADQIFRLYRDGTMSAVSVSWRPIEWKWANEPGRAPDGKDFLKVELLEISAVPLPAADPNALVSGRSANIEKEQRMAAVRAFAQPRTREPAFASFAEFICVIAHAATGFADDRLVRAPHGAGEVDAAGGGFLVPAN